MVLVVLGLERRQGATAVFAAVGFCFGHMAENHSEELWLEGRWGTCFNNF